jgi:hypothetical protein
VDQFQGGRISGNVLPDRTSCCCLGAEPAPVLLAYDVAPTVWPPIAVIKWIGPIPLIITIQNYPIDLPTRPQIHKQLVLEDLHTKSDLRDVNPIVAILIALI